jgi:NAD(P)-dependent dehydrogenase (short-subunit alcohol dehydrogenase family)
MRFSWCPQMYLGAGNYIVPMTPTLTAKHVVITGGDGALGHAVVQTFLAAGAVCHLPVLAPVVSQPTPAVFLTGNVNLTDETAVSAYFAGVPALWASVHLAGGFQAKPITETSRSDLDRQWEINLVTAFLCCREAVRAMRASGGGRIVNVAARVVEVPMGGSIAYSVSKAGVAALTRSLAVETKGDGILVNAVLPSIIDTPANRAAMPSADTSKWPKAEDLAPAILWLASPENRLTSGALVPVYGLG